MDKTQEYWLVVTQGPNQGRTYPIQGMIYTLGRASDNSLVIDSPRISRHHAQIRLLPSGTLIEDLGSTNGTWVNQRRVRDAQPLSSGDLVTLADFISFRYMVEEEMRTERSARPEPGSSTRVMGDESPVPESYDEGKAYATPEPETPVQAPEPDEIEFTPSYDPVAPDEAEGPEQEIREAAEEEGRPTWVYILIGLLVLLICACVAFAVYLWFAPVEFWEQVFELFGVPMPSSSLLLLISQMAG